jgi:hypothetical protein
MRCDPDLVLRAVSDSAATITGDLVPITMRALVTSSFAWVM